MEHIDSIVVTENSLVPTPTHTGRPLVSVANGEAFKAIVIGNADVGKSRMTYLFVNDELPPQDKSETVGIEYYSKTILFGMVDKMTHIPVTK